MVTTWWHQESSMDLVLPTKFRLHTPRLTSTQEECSHHFGSWSPFSPSATSAGKVWFQFLWVTFLSYLRNNHLHLCNANFFKNLPLSSLAFYLKCCHWAVMVTIDTSHMRIVSCMQFTNFELNSNEKQLFPFSHLCPGENSRYLNQYSFSKYMTEK